SILRAQPFSGFVPDGSANKPAGNTMIAIGTSNRRVQRVVADDLITHQNIGDLVGILTHVGQHAILNNHTLLNVQNPPQSNSFKYDDSSFPDPGSRRTDGPGTLNNFVGQKVIGPWIFNMIDNAPSHTGRV